MISLCMIVRDEKKLALKAINSLRDFVGEKIVVDTGSTDGTQDALTKIGCKVFDFPWCDDYSAARNFSLSKATGDWILIVDADEKMDLWGLQEMKRRIDSNPEKNMGFVITQRHYVLNAYLTNYYRCDGKYPAQEIGYPGYYASKVCRIFPNDKDLKFEGRIHEIVEPSMERKKFKIQETDIVVHHYGNVEHLRTNKKKAETYIRMLKIKSNETPDWKVFYDIGLESMTPDVNNPVEAEIYFTKSIQVQETEAAYVNRALMYVRINKLELALKDFKRALEIFPQSDISRKWITDLTNSGIK